MDASPIGPSVEATGWSAIPVDRWCGNVHPFDPWGKAGMPGSLQDNIDRRVLYDLLESVHRAKCRILSPMHEPLDGWTIAEMDRSCGKNNAAHRRIMSERLQLRSKGTEE